MSELSALFRVSTKLRRKIFSYLLPQNENLTICPRFEYFNYSSGHAGPLAYIQFERTLNTCTALFSVCKKISKEALRDFYANNTFTFELGPIIQGSIWSWQLATAQSLRLPAIPLTPHLFTPTMARWVTKVYINYGCHETSGNFFPILWQADQTFPEGIVYRWLSEVVTLLQARRRELTELKVSIYVLDSLMDPLGYEGGLEVQRGFAPLALLRGVRTVNIDGFRADFRSRLGFTVTQRLEM